MKKIKNILYLILCIMGVLLVGCGNKDSDTTKEVDLSTDTVETIETAETAETLDTVETTETAEPVEILVAAAASLQNAMEEIQKMYATEHTNVTITFTFGGSGALQEQIEQGAPVDVFMSAALKQMTVLEDENLIVKETKKELLQNKVVLIVPTDSELGITSFEDITKAPMIALGDPASVPVGQYAEEVFTSLGLLDKIKDKVTYAKDVTEVLTWVSTGNADAGVVYATDAMSQDDVTVITEAPEGSCSKVIYPVAVVEGSKVVEEATEFIKYLATPEAMDVFVKYGFTAN
jgi:molybdate transport system substrate-binding protein